MQPPMVLRQKNPTSMYTGHPKPQIEKTQGCSFVLRGQGTTTTSSRSRTMHRSKFPNLLIVRKINK